MNTAQIASAIRILIIFLGGIAVNRGWATQEQVDLASDVTMLTAVVGGAAAVIAAGYGIWVRRPAGLVAQAAQLPEVAEIKASPEIAGSISSHKVTAN